MSEGDVLSAEKAIALEKSRKVRNMPTSLTQAVLYIHT